MPNSKCPVCRVEVIPVYRSLCVHCFTAIPWKQRADFMQAHRMRAVRDAPYQEMLAELRKWYSDQLAGDKKLKDEK